MSVQEEINHKNIALVTRSTQITGRVLFKLASAYLRHHSRGGFSGNVVYGKQSVKNLAKQGHGLNTLDMNDGDIKKFHRVMKKYGIDYALTTDKTTKQATHTLFFKGKDADGITMAFKEFTAQVMAKDERPSLLAELKKCVERVKSQVLHKVKNKDKELSR